MSNASRIVAKRAGSTVERKVRNQAGRSSPFSGGYSVVTKELKSGDHWWKSRMAKQATKTGDDVGNFKRAQAKRKTRASGKQSPPAGDSSIDFKHCDDYIDDETAPAVLRRFLDRARSPGHGMMSSEPYPRLFADYRRTRVRVVMASRLGDIGITTDLTKEFGYDIRVAVADLANFGDES